MTSTIDSTGIQLESLSESIDNVKARLKAKFGDNLKTDDQSVSGALASVIGEIVSDQNDLIREAVNARNPQGATGNHLANIVQFNGVSRRSPEYSTVSLTVTALGAGTTIPAGSLVQDPSDSSIEFATDSIVTVSSGGSGTVSATATAAGAIEAAAGTLTKIVNPVYGWASVTNAAAASPGRAVETDTDLRYRRKYVSRQTGRHSLPKIFAALSNIDGIGRIALLENRTSYIDANGQRPHSVWAICQGATDAEIAAALFENTSGGIDWHGGSDYLYHDDTMDADYTIRFDRPTEVPIQIYIRNQRFASYPNDGDAQIKAAIVAYFAGEYVKADGETDNGFGIAESVSYFRLLTPVNSVAGQIVKEFTIARHGETQGIADLPMSPLELATIDTSDITIESY